MKININTDDVLKKVKSNCFYIAENAINIDDFFEIQNFWLKESLNIKKKYLKFVRGMFNTLGETNFNSFSDKKDDYFYRYSEFLWNKTISPKTRDLIYEIHKIRNRILNNHELDGIIYSEENKALYLTVNIYPNQYGCLAEHKDVFEENAIVLHSFIPLTFCGSHFEEGGLYIKDYKNKLHNLDNLAKPGSIVYFNGARPHGVNRIKSNSNNDRIAIYPMHSYFFNNNSVSTFLKKLIKFESKIKRRFYNIKQNQGLVSDKLDI